MSVDVKLIDKQTYEEKMDALILAVSGNNSGGSPNFSSYAQLQQLIRSGLGAKVLPVGTQLATERETSITIDKGDSTGITGATINEDTFLAQMGGAHEGIFEATYDGAVWHKENGETIILADYGIGTTGTPVEGDHLIITESAATLIWDVLDHDKHTFQNPALTKGTVIGMANCLQNFQFSAPQLLYYAPNGLAAGKYRITLYKGAYGGGTAQDDTYMFTLTQAIPSGGGFRHSTIGAYQSSYNKSQITGGTITTYGALSNNARATIESGIAVSIWDNSEATDLGTFSASIHANLTATNNSTERNAYGSNRWKTSALRQWLNSNVRAWKSGDTNNCLWWTAQTNFDMPPSDEGQRKQEGFLHGFGQDLLNLIQPVAIVCSLTDVDKSTANEQETTYDRVWLQSMTEMGWGNNNGAAEGSVFAYWYARNTNAQKIKYLNGSARYYWQRSAYPTLASNVSNVITDGGMSINAANRSYAVVPACVLG